MNACARKVIYRLYPSRSQEAALLDKLGLHQRLYNAALEQRITAWRLGRHGITFAQQCRELTELRADDDAYRSLNAQSAQVTLKRLDVAFTAFFRRSIAGKTPGFPRFKSLDRFSGWGYKTHGDGFRFIAGDSNRHGRLRLSGVGTVTVRGRARNQGEIVTCEIQHKAGRWYASLTVECTPQRGCGTSPIGVDWGVEMFATIAHEDGSFSEIPNPRFATVVKGDLEVAQRTMARKKAGSKNRHKAKAVVSTIQRKIANRRRDFLHQHSARLVAVSNLIATESLAIANMTRSARGSPQEPGRNVAQKAGLNREILSTAPSAFLAMLRYKAEEAGSLYVEVPSRTVKPTQRCSYCWKIHRKTIADRQHRCACGTVLGRDRNSARVNLLWALARIGREPAGCLTRNVS